MWLLLFSKDICFTNKKQKIKMFLKKISTEEEKGETESCCKSLNTDIPTTAILNNANLFCIDRTTKKVIILAVRSWSVEAFIVQDNSLNFYFVELL